ncbi:MAG: tRNA threonylcarbamoyladenosine dehydratase [Myxococcota bacterium]|nr:tRNA threonylcarbamoyladenosine dehydratase [Myxococcota bacterium]
MSDYLDRFGGVGRLVGDEGLERLSSAHVCIIGIGGVGSWAAEALARTGVGRLTLVDMDDVCITNTNRQVHAVDGVVGRPKVSAMAERIAAVNPDCQVAALAEFFTAETADDILERGFDFVVDAIDTVKHKCVLIVRCRAAGIPIVTVGGAGGKVDPAQIAVADLTVSTHDGLLRRVRKKLRQDHGLGSEGPWDLPCVFSTELPRFPTPEGGICDQPSPDTSLRLDCASGYGTASFVTGAFGFAAASVVVRALAPLVSSR